MLPKFQQTMLLQSSSHGFFPGVVTYFVQDKLVSDLVILLVLISACCGGCLHGIAMALRKKYGEGHEKYWLEWRWWMAVLTDGVAGAMIWPAMPFVSVQILMPLVVVVQLGTSYLLGSLLFEERLSWHGNAGLLFSVLGVVGLCLSTSHIAAPIKTEEFWDAWVAFEFLLANAICVGIVAGSFVVCHRSTSWAILCAVLEGLQYLCSRTMASVIYQSVWDGARNRVLLAAVALKVLCILGIVHFSQLGLESDLSRFAGIYLVGCTLAICAYGSVFFGDLAQLTLPFMASAFSTLAGIWLLNKDMQGADTDTKIQDNPQTPDNDGVQISKDALAKETA
jgi:hypothetical protein